MRARLLLLVPLLSACDDWDVDVTRANEIVFGIHQRVDAATGATSVTAGYEFLGLAHRGGWQNAVFRDGDGEGSCYFEEYGDRLGHLRVESGLATWSGAALPAGGLNVLANAPDVTYAGAAWKDGDTLAFETSGFAMPPTYRLTLSVPRTSLDITALGPTAEIKATDDVRVAWTPLDANTPTSVMVSLQTDAGAGVQCFSNASSGASLIPREWVARLFATGDATKPITGRLTVASHRQVTYITKGAWIMYVVATMLHREETFTGTR